MVQQYTSHMTGILSSAAYDGGRGEFALALSFLGFLTCFVLGAMCTTILILCARRYSIHAQFSIPLLVEACLLLLIVLLGSFLLGQPSLANFLIAIFCFLMGLQNALITKASTAIVRTTHVTGISTDIGILLGRLIMGTSDEAESGDQMKVILFLVILIAFFSGGALGAFLVTKMGVLALLPLSAVLITIALPAIVKDVRFVIAYHRRQARA